MRIEDYIANTYVIEQIKTDKDLKIEIEGELFYITTHLMKRAKYLKYCLPAVYALVKESNPSVATQIMAAILGSKDDSNE